MFMLKEEVLMNEMTESSAEFQKLREMIKQIDFCMLTTVDENNDLHSRPMSLNGEVDKRGISGFSPRQTRTKFQRSAARRNAMSVLPIPTTITVCPPR